MYDYGINFDHLTPYVPPAGGTATADPAAPAADAPPPDQTPSYASDAGMSPEWAAALAASATADYGALPFGQFMDPHQPVYDAAAAAGLDAEGVGMMQQLAMQGQLDRMGPINRSVGEEIVWRLENGAVSNDLAKTLMGQIIDPDTNIQQIGNHACVAATAQKAMAVENPGLYFVTGADLVNAGQGNLPNGEQVFVSEENKAILERYQVSGAELVDASFQAALMDHANGAATYNVETDTSTRPDGRQYTGLNVSQAAELNSDVLSAPTLNGTNILADFEARSMNPTYVDLSFVGGGSFEFTPPLGMVVSEHLNAARSQGFPGVFVPVAEAGGDRHMVLVRNIDNKNGQVSVMDASGASKQVPLWDFLNSVALTDNGPDGDNGIGTLTARAASGPTTVARTGRVLPGSRLG